MTYKYFISYAHSHGFGMSEMTLHKQIKNFDDVKLIKGFVEETNNLKDVVIINYKLFKRVIL